MHNKYWYSRRELDFKDNLAKVKDPNDAFKHFKDHHPENIYWRLFRVPRSRGEEQGKWLMTFDHTDAALELCKHGMVNVATLPKRAGEHIDTKKPPPTFEKVNWYSKLKQNKEFEKWRFFFPKLLDVKSDRPPLMFSASKY